jgi:hypothetical protein
MVLALLRLSPTKPDERPNRTRCVNLSSGAEGSGADLDHNPRDGRATSLYMAAAVTPVMVSGPRDRVTTDLRIQAKIIVTICRHERTGDGTRLPCLCHHSCLASAHSPR